MKNRAAAFVKVTLDVGDTRHRYTNANNMTKQCSRSLLVFMND